jgi:hypothetical protein
MRTETLDAFTRAYIEAALWSSMDGETDKPLDEDYGIDDLAQEAVDEMVTDCAAFQATHAEDIDAGPRRAKGGSDAHEQAGHDFWLTRNGHGCGFWDGDWPEPAATRLTDGAEAFGECTLCTVTTTTIHIELGAIMARTMKELAQEALDVQNACNLSGVVHSFARAMTDLRAVAEAEGWAGTQNINTHPICQLWADKIADLTGRDGAYNAFGWAREMARP